MCKFGSRDSPFGLHPAAWLFYRFLDLKTTQKRELSFAKLEHFECAVLGSTGIDSRVEIFRSFRSWKDSQLLTNLTGLLECTRSSWCIHQLHPWITPMSVKDTTARDSKKGPDFFSSVRCFFFQIGLWKLFSHDMKASFEGFEFSRCCMTWDFWDFWCDMLQFSCSMLVKHAFSFLRWCLCQWCLRNSTPSPLVT